MSEQTASETEAAPRPETEEAPEGSVGTLGAAFLQAGFGADGTIAPVAPAPPEEPEEEEAPAEESPEDQLPEWAVRTPAPPEEDPDPWGLSAADLAEAEEAAAEEPPAEDAAPPEPVVALEPEPVSPAAAEVEDPPSPYDLPGDWYVINSYSGHEKKVQANLMTRTSSMHMEERIFDVVIPTEKVVEIKGGRKEEVERKMFPGYLLVRMYLDDDSWLAVRNTPGVTAFVGSGTKPVPLSRKEVERFLGLKKEASKKPPRFKPAWEIGETVRVVAGPFADFNGIVEDINVDQQKVTVLVEIFGRDTPTELGFEDIQKQ